KTARSTKRVSSSKTARSTKRVSSSKTARSTKRVSSSKTARSTKQVASSRSQKQEVVAKSQTTTNQVSLHDFMRLPSSRRPMPFARAAFVPLLTLVIREIRIRWDAISLCFEAAERTNRFRKSEAVAFGAEFQPLKHNPRNSATTAIGGTIRTRSPP
ncbi:cobalamin biosynthesis Mg chelatase CobN, partial [Paenibacillus sp. LBL]|nr:cobalamin biosynthesis Mg chelatase CobN [Paenibacillus sp. LBL]